jgi:transcriptional regulator with XRE-family HTH domain
MSIGGTLAQARREAGLTVAQVSARTRIREATIQGIERDDYSGCGGDFYARGNIRSIAQAVVADPAPLIREYDATLRAPHELTAADALRPNLPVRPVARHGPRWTAILALVLLAAAGFVGYRVISGARHVPAAAAGYRVVRPAAKRPAARHPAATPSASPSASPAATPPPVTLLTPVSVVAFGPGGAAQGDNPELASLAIAGDPATPWYSDWYGTAQFDGLQAGTGLLLDMGRPVVITSALITLGSIPGADLELRVGDVPALADLQTVATATNAGGVLQLQPTRLVRGRYALIWFTLLPPNSSGTYQAYVSGIRLKGRA